MNYNEEIAISKKDKLIIKYKKKTYNLPKCIHILFFFLLLISFLSLIALKNVYNSLEKEKNLYLRQYFYKKNQIEDILNIINNLENNITLNIQKLDLFKLNYSIICSNYIKKNKEYLDTRKELYKQKIYLGYKQILFHSKIFTNYNQLKQIGKYVKNKLNLTEYYPKYHLLYNSNYDGIKGSDLINKILKKENIIIIIKIPENIIFGGYFHKRITNNKRIKDNNSFLFSLNYDEVYYINEEEYPYWIHNDIFFGFGKNDIFLADECFSNSYSLSNFPNAFGNKSCIENRLTDGKKSFKVIQVEAYELFSDKSYIY